MPDEISQKVAEFAKALPSVEWVEVAQIQRRARRRTRRTAAGASLAVIAVAALVWSGLQPARTPQVTGTVASAAPSTGLSTAPSPSIPSSMPASAKPTIPQLALLQPEDVGTGYQTGNPFIQYAGQMGGAWSMGWDPCPAYAGLNITAYQQAVVLIGYNLQGPDKTIFTKIISYPEGVARQVISDAKRVARACPYFTTGSESGDDHEVRRNFTVPAINFAGDESVLIRQRLAVYQKATGKHVPGYDNTTTLALIRRGNYVIEVYVEADETPLVKLLSSKAADRFCLAVKESC